MRLERVCIGSIRAGRIRWRANLETSPGVFSPVSRKSCPGLPIGLWAVGWTQTFSTKFALRSDHCLNDMPKAWLSHAHNVRAVIILFKVVVQQEQDSRSLHPGISMHLMCICGAEDVCPSSGVPCYGCKQLKPLSEAEHDLTWHCIICVRPQQTTAQ